MQKGEEAQDEAITPDLATVFGRQLKWQIQLATLGDLVVIQRIPASRAKASLRVEKGFSQPPISSPNSWPNPSPPSSFASPENGSPTRNSSSHGLRPSVTLLMRTCTGYCRSKFGIILPT